MTAPLTTFPPELQRLERWVLWRRGAADADGKFSKIPVHPDAGHACNDKDPATWRSCTTAAAAAQRWRCELGVALGEGLGGPDIDHCRDPQTEVIDDWAWAIIRLFNSYTEVSPSGTGVKILVWGSLPENIAGPRENGTIELYTEKRFFALTGQHVPGTPFAIANGQAALDQLAAELAPPPSPVDDTPRALDIARPSSPTQRPGRADARAVIDQFNADHPLPDLLLHYGAPLRGCRGDTYTFGGLPLDQHGHKITLKVSRRRNGTGWIGFSYSPNSRLAGPHGFDAFAVYSLVDHSGDRVAALKAINPIASAARPAPPAPPPIPSLTPEQLAKREADATRKRLSRQDEATATRTSLETRAAQDELLSNRGQIALLTLLDACGQGTATRWSNARLAAHAGFSERYMRSGLSEIERAGYIRCDTHANAAGEAWRGGSGTVWRTLVRWHGDPVAEGAPGGRATESRTHDHDSESIGCSEGGASAPAPRARPLPTPTAPNPATLLDLVLAAPTSLAGKSAKLADLPEPAPVPVADGAASYDPAADWTLRPTPPARPAGAQLPTMSARRKVAEAWQAEQEALAWERARAAALLERSDVGEQHQLVEPEPVLTLQPPQDPDRASRYWSLLGAAKKAQRRGNRAQAWKLEADARALEELRPAEPTRLPQEAAAPPPPSQAPVRPGGRSTRRAPAQPATVAQLGLLDALGGASDGGAAGAFP